MKPIVEIAVSFLLSYSASLYVSKQHRWDKCEWQAASATPACVMAPGHAADSPERERQWLMTEDDETSYDLEKRPLTEELYYTLICN